MAPEVVIPAAGLGTRMIEYTDELPKCLVRLNDTTVLEHQLNSLTDLGIARSGIHLVIGTSGDCWTQDAYDRITSIHDNVLLNFENTNNGPAFTVKLGVEAVTADELLIIDGDVVFKRSLLQTLLDTDESSAIIAKRAEDRAEPGSKVVTDDTGKVTNIGKEITPETFPWDIYGGIAKVAGAELSVLRTVLNDFSLDDADAADVLGAVADRSDLYVHTNDDQWINMNTPSDLERAEQMDI